MKDAENRWASPLTPFSMLVVLGLGAGAFDIDGTFLIPLETPPKHFHNIERRGCGGQGLKRETLHVQLSLVHALYQMVLYLSRPGTLFRPCFLLLCFAGALNKSQKTQSKNPSPNPKSHRLRATMDKSSLEAKFQKNAQHFPLLITSQKQRSETFVDFTLWLATATASTV